MIKRDCHACVLKHLSAQSVSVVEATPACRHAFQARNDKLFEEFRRHIKFFLFSQSVKGFLLFFFILSDYRSFFFLF
jgi:hypothetical protein